MIKGMMFNAATLLVLTAALTVLAPIVLWLLAALAFSIFLYVRKTCIVFRKRPESAAAVEAAPDDVDCDEGPVTAGGKLGNALSGIFKFTPHASLILLLGGIVYLFLSLGSSVLLVGPLLLLPALAMPVQFVLTSFLRSLNQKLNDEERRVMFGVEEPRRKIVALRIAMPALPALAAATIVFSAWYWGADTGWYRYSRSGEVLIISTARELAGLAEITNGTWGGTPDKDDFKGKTVRLAADINLARYFNWTPISSFSGTFDGGGHVISNLTANHSEYVGLFGVIRGGRVENLGLKNVNIKGKERMGGVAGCIFGGAVANCYTTGKVSGRRNYIGGVVGYIDNGTVTNSYSTCNVSGDCVIGGIAGKLRDSSSSVINCAALNPQVSGNAYRDHAGRYMAGGRRVADVADTAINTLLNNAAYAGMKNYSGYPEWHDMSADKKDGASLTAAEIRADPTLGGRFTAKDGWTTENGKLPGLRGRAVELPGHLRD